jgi:2'-5' RNA ligase
MRRDGRRRSQGVEDSVTQRLFVALELPPAAKDGILTVIEDLRSLGVRASWSRAATIHLTLAFLGDTDAPLVDDVSQALLEACSPVAPFEWTVERLGAFPSPRRPRVIWAGVTAPETLFELKRRVDDALGPLGFPPERRRFRPHITLGRIRRDDDASGLERHLASIEVPEAVIPSDEVFLMKSTLRPGGALHEVLGRFPLAGRHDALTA